MRVSYDKGYSVPLPEGHIFPMQKFVYLHRYLIRHKVIAPKDVVAPSMINTSNLLTAHTKRYTKGMIDGTLSKKEIRKLGLPWSAPLARRSRRAVQGTLNAGIMALQDGIAGNLAGGTHHAMADYGEGFCVFNDVAVAVKVLQRSCWAKRILIVDCDVHQGNGTATLLGYNKEVFTFSIHGEKNYPFKKPPSTLDIGLPDGTGDAVYLRTLSEALEHIFGRFEPDLVFYLGGIDPLETDKLGRLSLTKEGLFKRDKLVVEKVLQKNWPLVLLLSGGYAPTLDQTVEAHALMYKAANVVISTGRFAIGR